MDISRRSAAALLAAVALSAAALPGCSYSYQSQRATVLASTSTAVPAATTVGADVSTSNGKLVITQDPTNPGATVTAQAKLVNQDRADRFTVEARLTDDGVLVVRPVWPDGERQNNESCSIEITAPALERIVATTSNGSIRISGGRGKADVHTNNGSIGIADRDGDINARTSNGRIEIYGGAGALELVSSNGAISIKGTAPGSAYHWRASTSNGSIHLDLVEPLAGRVRASTSNGKATISRRDGSGEPQRMVSARSIDHDLGGGAGDIVLTTSSGSIVVVSP